jgi:hypothetical protein
LRVDGTGNFADGARHISGATVKIGMANIAYNMLRYVFYEGRRAAA